MGRLRIRAKVNCYGAELRDTLAVRLVTTRSATPSRVGQNVRSEAEVSCLANLTPVDRTVIREFHRRFAGMPPRNADRLALTLAKKFVKKTGYPLTERFRSGMDAYRFLPSLLRDLEAVRRHG